MQEATDCVAGVILLGVPHTWDIQRALGFCKLASFAFSAQPDTDYGSRLIKLCKEVESSNTPTFSIYESEKTGISRVKRNLVSVSNPLSLLCSGIHLSFRSAHSVAMKN